MISSKSGVSSVSDQQRRPPTFSTKLNIRLSPRMVKSAGHETERALNSCNRMPRRASARSTLAASQSRWAPIRLRGMLSTTEAQRRLRPSAHRPMAVKRLLTSSGSGSGAAMVAGGTRSSESIRLPANLSRVIGASSKTVSKYSFAESSPRSKAASKSLSSSAVRFFGELREPVFGLLGRDTKL